MRLRYGKIYLRFLLESELRTFCDQRFSRNQNKFIFIFFYHAGNFYRQQLFCNLLFCCAFQINFYFLAVVAFLVVVDVVMLLEVEFILVEFAVVIFLVVDDILLVADAFLVVFLLAVVMLFELLVVLFKLL